MRLRMALVAMAAMVLTSCWWAGPAFFKGDPADASPIKPGLYQMWSIDTSEPKAREKAARIRVVWQPDGSTRWVRTDPGKPDDVSTAVMARLAVPSRDLWIVQTPLEKNSALSLYSLAEMRGGVMWVLPVIDCAATAGIVRAAGGEVTDSVPLTNEIDLGMETNMTDDPPPPPHKDCTFPTRASLDAALTAYLATKPAFTQRLRFTRIGN